MPTDAQDNRPSADGQPKLPAERPPAAPPSLGSEMSSSSSTATVQRRSPSATRQNSTPSTRAPTLRKQHSASMLPTSSSQSSSSSPRTSRNPSPIRKDGRPSALSSQSSSSQPSAAAIQRALSASNVPQLSAGAGGAVTDAVSKLPSRAGPKSAGPASGETTPQWPPSPRLKSPPPASRVTSRQASLASLAGKKAEEPGSASTPTKTPVLPSISVQGATSNGATPPQTSQGSTKQGAPEPVKGEQQSSLQPTKMPSRGPSGKSVLETVQENSSDATADPSPAALQAAADLKPASRPLNEDKTPRKDHEDYEKHTKTGESESECGGNKSEGMDSPRAPASQAGSSQQKSKFSTPTPKNTFPALTSTKSRQPEGTRNMTVETETVQSIPQSSINTGDRLNGGRGENSGSVRLKPSNETIRPKKERKKPSAKARSVNQGTGTFRSPLLLPRDSIDDLHGATCVSSTASMSEDEGPGLPGPRREQRLPSNLSHHFRNALTSTFSRKPSSFFRGTSRHGSNRVTSEASSKADIFEARVANAVEDANSSDSDETFVYESNPPEQQRRPRHHSRTPSVTSSHSIAESRSNVRHYNDAMEERRVNGKRSMKFSNNPFNEMDSPNERQDGTVRSHQPRHYGRWGRGGSHASMFDADSPFTQASKLRNNATNLRHSRPNSPRSPQSMQFNRASGPSLFGARRKDNSFDFDGEGADDERTPLVGTVRTSRSARSGYHGSGANSFDNYQPPRERSRCSSFAGCMIGLVATLVMVLCAVAFLVMSNRPMYDLQIEKVQNVLASEQEIMLDLLVGAVNPNALGITVTDMDVNLFAKSKHVGNSGDFIDDKRTLTTSISVPPPRRSRLQTPPATSDWHDWYPNKDPKPGHDHGTDPDDSLEGDAQTMLLGRIFHFDQALTFEGSPIKRHPHHSIGEMRLAHPGNRTEAGGSVRWEEVLKHPFELIIRGVLRYQLPISSRVLSAAVSASVTVHPEDGVDDDGNMRLEIPDHSEDWEWVDWNDLAAGIGPGGERARLREESG